MVTDEELAKAEAEIYQCEEDGSDPDCEYCKREKELDDFNAEQDRKEEFRQEMLDDMKQEAYMDFLSDNPDLYKEFIEDNGLMDDFKKYVKQAYEDSR